MTLMTEHLTEAHRLTLLPPYATAQLEVLRSAAEANGLTCIDLGIGSPDQPTPKAVIERMIEAIQDPSNHRYPAFRGKPAFRRAIAEWYRRHYNVELDPDKEVLPLIGSKEGLAKLALAFVNPGDVVIVPDPSYPVHQRGTILAGGELCLVPLRAEREFLPDWAEVPATMLAKARLLFYNFPNNPTAAVAPRTFHEETVEFARKNDLILVHDLAYAELAFDGYRPTSLLEIPGAKDRGVEFHTMSKTYNMAGWRCGFAVGNARVLEQLYRVKTNMDYGIFGAIQDAAISALSLPQSHIEQLIAKYQRRRDVMVAGLESLGWKLERPKATMYVWAPVPPPLTSYDFVADVINRTGVIFTPGSGFGAAGEGFFRVSLVAEEHILKEAIARLHQAKIRYPA
ncbi:MAG: LL-diaminopimelate aminotransferase [Cyanobacteria bacterium NC_groundwater_1444_Ag_S-0.65um_54_12]|nr:LL-diaminopimelate aminotransferase [Cyanobacteria bacterium NC_groundwater_1444_Ag_S-0.65um_54_12]